MSNTRSSIRARRMGPSKQSNSRIQQGTNYVDLQQKLNRLRAALTQETMMSRLIAPEPELFPDPTDQAAAEHELDVALSVKMLVMKKLRRIEQALTSLQARSYGICSRCAEEIPSARLKMPPDSLYCVPCLTLTEQQAARN